MPKTPQQNGVSERGHRTIGERVWTMLADSRLPEYLWGEAFMCTIYTKNLTASVRQKGRTPYRRCMGEIPDVGHLRAFGSLAWVKVPDDSRKKLNPKSRRGFLVGYTEDANYQIWVPQEGSPMGSVIRSHNVVFEEGQPHRTLTAEGELDLDGFVLPGNPFSKQDIKELLNADEDDEEEDRGEKERAEDREMGMGEREWVEVEGQEEREGTPEGAGTVRRSTRETKPSRAMAESREYEERERVAKAGGQAWAKLVDVDARYVALMTAAETNSSTRNNPYEGGTTPQTLREAMKEAAIWEPAMDKEIRGLRGIGTWTLIPRRSKMNIVGCKWAYARKFDAEGHCWKPKA